MATLVLSMARHFLQPLSSIFKGGELKKKEEKWIEKRNYSSLRASLDIQEKKK